MTQVVEQEKPLGANRDAHDPEALAPDQSCPLDMSRILIMDFVSTLEHQASSTGTVDVGTLRSTAEIFLERLRASTKAPDSCIKMHQRMLWDERRRHPFERLFILRFAHTLPKRHGDDGVQTGAQMSRRAIPGLAVALTKMLGLDQYRTFENVIRQQLRIYKVEHPGPIDWDHLATHPEFHHVIDQALLAITGYFTDLEKRIPWLVEVINSHLGPPPPEDGPQLWVMTPERTLIMLSALFRNLRHSLRRNPNMLIERYGGHAIASLRTFDQALNDYGYQLDESGAP